MYYITNQNGQIIAASSDLLALLQAKNFDALYKQITLNAIEFVTEDEGITLKTPLYEIHYKTKEEPLSGLLGEMTLVHLAEEAVSENSIEEPGISLEEGKGEELSFPEEEPLFEIKENTLLEIEPENEEEAFSLIDEKENAFSSQEEESLFEAEAKENPPLDEIKAEEEEPFLLIEKEEEPLFEIKETGQETETAAPEPEIKEKTEEAEDDLFDLILPSNAEETIAEIGDKAVPENAAKPVYIDVEKISQSIGVSEEDYNTFLTEYIDTALSLENDLKSSDQGKRTAATHTLFHLSNVLRLPVITEIVEQLKYTEAEDIGSSISSFYDTLSRLTTTKPETEASETTVPAATKENQPEAIKGFGTIDLSDVKPIHFDFQVEEAAKDLSLPAELIEEFIHDFIKQAHEETDKMLEAYEKGDLETINKIGHLLKGTASNLRINPLADTLYEVQFCNDSSKLEPLIKEYWAHFLSFETQFNLTTNKGK